MRRGVASAFLLCAVFATGSRVAKAEVPRDYFLDPPRPGNYAHTDAYTIGSQLSLENRSDLEKGMSMLYTRASGIVSLPYADGSMNLDARVFLFTFGGSVGYRYVYRNLTLPPGKPRTITARTDLEDSSNYDTQGYAYEEGRVRLTVPLDSFFLINTLTFRNEGCRDNTFDWYHADIHDGGMMTKDESTLFFRHRDFGAIGPYFRWMSIPKDHSRSSEAHIGIVYGTRPGLISTHHHNSDLFLLQIVGKLGGSFLDKEYGLQGWHMPLYILAVYRASLSLE